jgi:hypothetical protein
MPPKKAKGAAVDMTMPGFIPESVSQGFSKCANAIGVQPPELVKELTRMLAGEQQTKHNSRMMPLVLCYAQRC